MKKIFLLLTYLLIFNNQQLYSQTCGFFTPVNGSPFAAGSGPLGASFSPLIGTNTLFAAAANISSNNGSSYTVNTKTGALTPTSGSPFATGTQPDGLAFSPLTSINTLYAAVVNSSNNTVSVYSVNINTGQFMQVTGSPFSTGNTPRSVAFSPLIGTTLYAAVVNSGDNTVSVYTVDINTGHFMLIPGPSFATGTSPIAVTFSPLIGTNTLFAAVANQGSSNVSVYNVNVTTGVFTQIINSPFAAGTLSSSVAFSPLIGTNTLFAAVSNLGSNNVSVYSVNTTTGAFTPVSGSPFNAGLSPASVAFSPLIGTTTLFAAVSNENGNDVSVYSVNLSSGHFTQVTGSPFAAGNGPQSVAFSPLIGTNTVYAIVANTGGTTLSVFSVASLKALISPTIQVACGNGIIQFNASVVGGQAPYTYEWTGPNGFSENTGNNPTLTIANPTSANTGDYFVTITDSLDCQGSSVTSEVVVSSCI